jgi:hypothetical protein
LPALFGLALFISSALLFLIQPIIAKMVLPLLGGAPAVWNTSMVFFQLALLAGYAYAHSVPAWIGVRRHAVVHVVLLLLPLLILPFGLRENWTPPSDTNPIPWLLTFLTVTVGLPFFVLSTNAPLLQLWFANTGHTAGKDPYFLYGASNLGSMLALLSYPVLLEPSLPLAGQSLLWTFAYGLMVLLVVACVYRVWRSHAGSTAQGRQADAGRPIACPEARQTEPPSLGPRPIITRLRWIALAFAPSSLMLSVTLYLTTEIAAIPLLWIIPLAIYLLSFILVFSRKSPVPRSVLLHVSSLSVLLLVVTMLAGIQSPSQLLLPLHLFTFFMIALSCHGELAAERPGVRYLTEFYLWLAVGGALGGLFSALVAPLVFADVWEYPLVLALACLLRQGLKLGAQKPISTSKEQRKRKEPIASRVPSGRKQPSSIIAYFRWTMLLDIVLPLGAGLLAAALVMVVMKLGLKGPRLFVFGVMFGIPALICYSFVRRPLRFGLGVIALLMGGSIFQAGYWGIVHCERSFFGVHRIRKNAEGTFLELVHGNTNHGRQSLDPKRRRWPLAYYYPSGPLGRVFAAYAGEHARKEVAVIGLGVGSIAAYGMPGQHFTFYEIDPTVVHIARDSGHFTFVTDCRARLDIEMGDARLTLRGAKDEQFGMIVVDAFNSDSIPLHLITREAFRLYKSKLAGDGILVFHFSAGYLELEPVLGHLGHDAGLVCWVMYDVDISETEWLEGKSSSQWMVMARRPSDLAPLLRRRGWRPAEYSVDRSVWTDDFSNLLGVFRWE